MAVLINGGVLVKMLEVISDTGRKSIKKAVCSSVLKQIASWFSFVCSMFLVYHILRDSISTNITAIVFAAGLVLMTAEIFITKLQYKTTNIPSYHEEERIRLALAAKLGDIPMSYYNNKTISDIAGAILDDCSKVEKMISGLLPEYYASIFTISIIFIVLAIIDYRLAIAAFVTVPLSVGAQALSLNIQGKLVERHLVSKRYASSKMQEYIDGMAQIRANSQGGERCRELTEALAAWRRDSLKMELTSGVFTAGADVVLQLGIGIVVFTAARYLMAGTVDAFTMILFFSAMLGVYMPVSSQISRLPNLVYTKKSIARISEILSLTPVSGKETPEIKKFDIELKNVDFSYSATPVLKQVSFTAREGEVTAIVGPTGSGKTTVTNLLARFWDANGGKILLGDVDITKIQPEHYTKYISFVFQDVVLFNDTIYNNILIGNPDASEDDVVMAAKMACCDEFIRKLPDGYQTMLMENGRSLSGGERQRIAIARAMLKNAPIVILDEATSSLDTMNEYYIHQAMSELTKGKTVIVVAHTLRNIVNADNIVVLDNGEVVECGRHAELIKHDGIYARLYTIQKQAAEWDVR